MKGFGSQKIIFDKMTAVRTWSNLILCLYNVDALNIGMKEFGSQSVFFLQNDRVVVNSYLSQLVP